MLTARSEVLTRPAPVPLNKQCDQRQIFVQPHLSHGKPAPDDCACHMLNSLSGSAVIFEIARGAEIVAQGESAEYCFQVMEGCVRTVRRLEDGRRQVGEFLLPGDIFGWETIGEHEFAAEAVTPVTVRRLRLTAIEERADEDRVFAQRLRRYVAGQVKVARGRLVVLGRLTAAERIAAFLLEMNTRLGGSAKAAVELPMCRTDMADYLGLTIETVSRGLTELRRRGAITVKGAWIAIHDRRALNVAGAEWLH